VKKQSEQGRKARLRKKKKQRGSELKRSSIRGNKWNRESNTKRREGTDAVVADSGGCEDGGGGPLGGSIY
jgi:hypothetical protein